MHAEIRATGSTHGSTLTVVMVNRTKSELTTLSLGDSSALLIYHQASASPPFEHVHPPSWHVHPASRHLHFSGELPPERAPQHHLCFGHRNPAPPLCPPPPHWPHSHPLTTCPPNPCPPKSMHPTQAGVADTQRLTAEHRLQDSARERARVASLGGVVARIRHPVTGEPGGPLRCFPGGLAIARGIGDADAGDLVSPIPATSTVALSASNGWDVVIASDGVWDSLPPRDVVKLCRLSKAAPPAKTAALVVDAAISKRHTFDNSGLKQPRDDTTAVVIRSRGLMEETRGGGCQVGERCDRSKFDLSLIAVDPVVLDDHVRDEVIENLDMEGGGGAASDGAPSQPSAPQHHGTPQGILVTNRLNEPVSAEYGGSVNLS